MKSPPSITHIVNLSINQSGFTSIWKKTKIIPLFKPGAEDQLSAKSYRPVALLPEVSKVLERVVFLQIVEYMDNNGLFRQKLLKKVLDKSRKVTRPARCHLCKLGIEHDDELVNCRVCAILAHKDCEAMTGEDCGSF